MSTTPTDTRQQQQAKLSNTSRFSSPVRTVITGWLLDKQLSPMAAERALQLSGELPKAADWNYFLQKFFLFGGALLLVAGIIFLFAFNWSVLPRFAKFTLLEGLLIAAALSAHRYTLDTRKGQAALFAAMLSCGALLAYFGQTYQTGADPYQLFLTWSILIFPWVLISRLNIAWCLWLTLLNVTLMLYPALDQIKIFWFLGPKDFLYDILFWLNLLIWGTAEIVFHRQRPDSTVASYAWRYRYFMRFSTLLTLACGVMFSNSLVILVVTAAFYVLYFRRRDLLLLTGCCFALIAIGAMQIINFTLFLFDKDGTLSLLSLSLFLMIALVTASLWFARLQRQWRVEERI
ncbi:DUF2157 domain-containing protein [Glaciimonas immobilis]|uniref:Putative membrane protein n=1 Tax=Glaciimonas immobilis TaxID=728004 RepID=A0A840RQZ5_9BURK|nr:DUF2157 domain-containing protein [Glaciimonas immobilis]KAF3997928.1 DUF2157 domain-containing protein [Glaciimonas immobilis]MBB5199408.1 putative membrane protein [Glaciimonas immobilis]